MAAIMLMLINFNTCIVKICGFFCGVSCNSLRPKMKLLYIIHLLIIYVYYFLYIPLFVAMVAI